MDVIFEDNSIKVKEALNNATIAWLYEVGGEFEAQTKRNTPVDLGQLKKSWEYKVNEGSGATTVGSSLENSLWNEFGTGDYADNGDGRQTPWFVPVNDYTGAKKPTYNGKVEIVYGKNGIAYYKTNGKKAQHTLQNSYETLKNKVQSLLANKLKGMG